MIYNLFNKLIKHNSKINEKTTLNLVDLLNSDTTKYFYLQNSELSKRIRLNVAEI
jgi:hypothetical protein